jgi:hypothetical protein
VLKVSWDYSFSDYARFVTIFNNWSKIITPYTNNHSIDIHHGNYGWRKRTKNINDLVIFDPVC